MQDEVRLMSVKVSFINDNSLIAQNCFIFLQLIKRKLIGDHFNKSIDLIANLSSKHATYSLVLQMFGIL